MKTFQGYHLITPDDLHWRRSNLMRIPNADFLERTGSENLSARLWHAVAAEGLRLRGESQGQEDQRITRLEIQLNGSESPRLLRSARAANR